MDREVFTVSLISDVFFGPDAAQRLRGRLWEARAQGAELAVLPELPLNPWSPATKTARAEDAEPAGGPRHRALSDAARGEGIAVIGGAIVVDPKTGLRHNTALVFDAKGELRASYRKVHVPEEPGFWETSHYSSGDEPPATVDAFPMLLGLQICSDINRPVGCQMLGAMGAELIAAPRATELATFPRWRLVFQANALTSGAFVVSVNRPGPEQGVLIGGPSIAVSPNGNVVAETTDSVCTVRLAREDLRRARSAYPGYLPHRASLYARGWASVDRRPKTPEQRSHDKGDLAHREQHPPLQVRPD